MNSQQLDGHGPSFSELESELIKVIEEADKHVRKSLIAKLLINGGSLRSSGQDCHGLPLWYGSRSERELHAMGFPMRPLNLDFEVPPECPAWHAAEFDETSGLPYRFFVGDAFLVAKPASPVAGVHVRVLHGLTSSARENTHMHVEGGGKNTSISRIARADGSIDIIAHFANLISTPIVIHFTCTERGVPAHLYADSHDERLLSAAVTVPEWIDTF